MASVLSGFGGGRCDPGSVRRRRPASGTSCEGQLNNLEESVGSSRVEKEFTQGIKKESGEYSELLYLWSFVRREDFTALRWCSPNSTNDLHYGSIIRQIMR